MNISQQLQRDIDSLGDGIDDIITDADMIGSSTFRQLAYEMKILLAELEYKARPHIESIEYDES